MRPFSKAKYSKSKSSSIFSGIRTFRKHSIQIYPIRIAEVRYYMYTQLTHCRKYNIHCYMPTYTIFHRYALVMMMPRRLFLLGLLISLNASSSWPTLRWAVLCNTGLSCQQSNSIKDVNLVAEHVTLLSAIYNYIKPENLEVITLVFHTLIK